MKPNASLAAKLTGLVLALSSQAAVAEAEYFNGDTLEEIRPVTMISAPRTSENLEREAHVSSIVDRNIGQLKYCFEKAQLNDPSTRVMATFYFTVTADGGFSNVSADISRQGSVSTAKLMTCASSRIQRLRAASWNSGQTFRFRTLFTYNL